ncbi:MAG: hypothetical protein GF398_02040 [Chitinivibrionales bacterium]|nr:hypothetical protein [Chitinivibrionales bacterium]
MQSIFGILPDFIIAFVFMVLVGTIKLVSNIAIGASIPFAGRFAESFATLYLLLAQMYILGKMYYVNRKELSWFGEWDREQHPLSPQSCENAILSQRKRARVHLFFL